MSPVAPILSLKNSDWLQSSNIEMISFGVALALAFCFFKVTSQNRWQLQRKRKCHEFVQTSSSTFVAFNLKRNSVLWNFQLTCNSFFQFQSKWHFWTSEQCIAGLNLFQLYFVMQRCLKSPQFCHIVQQLLIKPRCCFCTMSDMNRNIADEFNTTHPWRKLKKKRKKPWSSIGQWNFISLLFLLFSFFIIIFFFLLLNVYLLNIHIYMYIYILTYFQTIYIKIWK